MSFIEFKGKKYAFALDVDRVGLLLTEAEYEVAFKRRLKMMW